MAAVFSAFVQSLATVLYFVAIAAAGIFAGKVLLKKKKEKEQNSEESK